MVNSKNINFIVPSSLFDLMCPTKKKIEQILDSVEIT